MTADPLWPGLHRAGDVFSAHAVLQAMVDVEAAWAQTLEEAGLAPAGTAEAVRAVTLSDVDVQRLSVEAEGGANPLIPLLTRIRLQVKDTAPEAAPWVHRGLTSQDVVDSALALLARGALDEVGTEVARQRAALVRLADTHRHTLMAGRTLGQHALPITFGAKAAGWLRGLQAAAAHADRARSGLAVQVGGASGTLAAVVEVCRGAGWADPVAAARGLADRCAQLLGLRASLPWHTTRTTVTSVGDALVTVSDALGHIAADVSLMTRPELGELSEPAVQGRGVSSAMPHKRNPVLAVMLRRHALSAPLLGAQLHVAAASAIDERPDGAWHAEWAALRDLAVRTVAATRQATELLTGLEVHQGTMRANLETSMPAILSERLVPALGPLLLGGKDAAAALVGSAGGVADLTTTLREQVGPDRLSDEDLDALLDPAAYLGACERLVDETIRTETERP